VPDPELAALPGGIDAYFNLNTPDDLANAERRLAPEGER
jgi:molybdopterin-guanine dinucleotide biosynthesis protein A